MPGIVEPPRVLPPALVASLDEAERVATRVRSRTSMTAFGAMLVFIAVVPFVEVRSWPLMIGFFGSMLGMAIVSWLSYRRGAQILWISLTTTFITTLFASRIASPFVMTPVITCGLVLGLTAIPRLGARPWLMFAWISSAVVAPVALEATGVFRSTWAFVGATMTIRSSVLHGTNRTIETVALVAVHLALIAMAGRFASTTSRDRRAAEHRLHIQAWHLRQLLPSRSPTGLS